MKRLTQEFEAIVEDLLGPAEHLSWLQDDVEEYAVDMPEEFDPGRVLLFIF